MLLQWDAVMAAHLCLGIFVEYVSLRFIYAECGCSLFFFLAICWVTCISKCFKCALLWSLMKWAFHLFIFLFARWILCLWKACSGLSFVFQCITDLQESFAYTQTSIPLSVVRATSHLLPCLSFHLIPGDLRCIGAVNFRIVKFINIFL
jgi:hypothetical protein